MILRIIHRITGLIIFVIMAAAGLTVLAAAVLPGKWDVLANIVSTGRTPSIFIGIVFVCLALIFILSGISRKADEKFLSFDGEDGTVSISTVAISDYVAKLISEFPSIAKMKPVVVPGRNSIDIIVNIRVKAGPDIHDVCQVLQKRVREVVTTGLGITDVRRVEISVREIVSEHKL